MGRRARLLFAAAGRARPDQPRPWAQTGLDRRPPQSDAGGGGSRSRTAARYSSVASLPGAVPLVLAESKRPTLFPDESEFLIPSKKRHEFLLTENPHPEPLGLLRL